MQLISYNILDGGADRAEMLLEVIQHHDPQVVALVEADDPAVVEKLANRLKMDFIHAPGNSKASALLSVFPILQTINHAPLHQAISKSFLEATVRDPAGVEWTIGVVHLHARAFEADEVKREREIEEVLNIFQQHRDANRPHLLAGDFNSNALYQKIEPDRCKPTTRQAWKQNGGQIPRRVVQRLLDAGYVDTLRAVHPNEAETAGTFSTEFPGQRVDYIFSFAIDRIATAWIDDDPPASEASDHFPIGITLA